MRHTSAALRSVLRVTSAAHRPRLALSVAIALTLLAGCGSGGSKEVEVPAQRGPGMAAEQTWTRVALTPPPGGDRAAWRESLKRLAWRRSEPSRPRLDAIIALADDDADDTTHMLNLMLPTETNWDVIRAVGELAAERHWATLTTGLVRSWSRPVLEPADDERPERLALTRLHPGRTVEEVIFEVFAVEHEGRFGERTRSDAWALLVRIDPDDRVTSRLLRELDTGSDADPMLRDLRAAAQELGVAPRTTEQLEWLRRMREPAHEAFWGKAREVVSALGAEQRQGLELRHISGVVWASSRRPQWLAASRAELHETCRRDLATARRHQRLADAMDRMTAIPETLDAWKDALSWGDLLMILIARQSLRDAEMIAELFEQADVDLRDTSTEHGGAIDAVGLLAASSTGEVSDGFVARPFPPRAAQRMGDNRFVASIDLLEASTTSLLHYHFHAQRYDNSDYAGPGPGDMEYADALGRACVVFTFVNRSTMNADYFQPGGARVDLGEIRRPGR